MEFVADLFGSVRKPKTMVVPARNSLRLVLMEIKSTYFDPGLRELTREDCALIESSISGMVARNY